MAEPLPEPEMSGGAHRIWDWGLRIRYQLTGRLTAAKGRQN
jgi:hypothetical protein